MCSPIHIAAPSVPAPSALPPHQWARGHMAQPGCPKNFLVQPFFPLSINCSSTPNCFSNEDSTRPMPVSCNTDLSSGCLTLVTDLMCDPWLSRMGMMSQVQQVMQCLRRMECMISAVLMVILATCAALQRRTRRRTANMWEKAGLNRGFRIGVFR